MTRMQLGMASQETLTSHKGIVTWWKFNKGIFRNCCKS